MRFRSLAVHGIEDLESATGGNREFRPTQMGLREPTGRLALWEFGGLTLTYGRWRADIHVAGTLADRQLSLGILLAGSRGVTVLGKDAKPGDLVVVGEGRENDARYRSELEYVVASVDEADVLRLAEEEDLVIPRAVLDGHDLLRPEGGKAARLGRRMRKITEGLRDGPLRSIGPEAERSLADAVVREFVYCLSGAIPGERVGRRPRADLPRLVKRAEDWLDAEPSVRPSIQEMSRVLGVSPRQLYRAFDAEVGMSPAKFLRHHRMTQARLELVDADPAETNVTHVAHSWSFWELGRFAVEYRQLFGESPSETLQRHPAFHGRGLVATPTLASGETSWCDSASRDVLAT
jgi:AraC family ethanolamine operon transcriptional activator